MLFVVGAQGAGHGLVEAVLTERLGLHPLGYHSLSGAGVNLVEETAEASSRLLSMLASKPYALFSQWTFPLGRQAEDGMAEAHPSLMNLVCLNLTAAIDLRLLYLRRDPAHSLCSALRRALPYESQQHARGAKTTLHQVAQDSQRVEQATRVAVDSLTYISAILRHPQVAYDVLDVVQAAKDQTSMAPALKRLLAGVKGVATPEMIDAALLPRVHAYNSSLEEAVEQALKEEDGAARELHSYVEGDEECFMSGHIKKQMNALRFFLNPDLVP